MAAEATGQPPRGARLRLGFATAGVLLGAADTYVVVIALPAIMASVGIDLAHLQQATPIISGFLLGYVAVLPLVGRLSDTYGRAPVLSACLALFAGGSLVTASASSLGAVVAGRTLQGVGGGGLVPVTLALVADLWPPHRRGVPLGVVGAVQELGSVAGPLYGAALTAAGTWRAIFYVNLPLAALVAVGVRARGARPGPRTTTPADDVLGWVLAGLGATAAVLVIAAPPALTDSVSLGTAFVPLIDGLAPSSPLGLVALLGAAAFVVRELTAPASVRPLVPLRGLGRGLRRVDWAGALLLALVLGCVVAVFAGADPRSSAISPASTALLPAAAVLLALFVAHELRARDPLVDLRALRHRAAAGSLLANLLTGAALMAALVDIPVFARATADPGSQVAAALVLARLLVAVPVGAIAGGLLVGALGHRVVGGVGLLVTAAMFALMSRWTATTLSDPLLGVSWLHPSDPVLVACGIGFGLSVVPITAAILGAVPARLHGVAAALTVAARMVGMLTGVSVLTALGLRRFYSLQAMLPDPASLCPRTPLNCATYNALETGAVLDELHVIFAGAAVCALVAAAVAVALLQAPPRDRPPARVLGLGVA